MDVILLNTGARLRGNLALPQEVLLPATRCLEEGAGIFCVGGNSLEFRLREEFGAGHFEFYKAGQKIAEATVWTAVAP